jgi:hypothetical protein
MRRLRSTVLVTLAVTLSVVPGVAAAQQHNGSGAVVAPMKDAWLGASWAYSYSLPSTENPVPCLPLANKVIQEPSGGPCTIEQGTALMLRFGTAWSTAEYPFPQTAAEQLALAVAADLENVVGMTITVDGGDPVDIHIPRFELFSPQETALLPEDNILDNPDEGIDVPAQTVTLSAHAWGAVIRKLSVGEHIVVADVYFADGGHGTGPHLVTVVPKHDE